MIEEKIFSSLTEILAWIPDFPGYRVFFRGADRAPYGALYRLIPPGKGAPGWEKLPRRILPLAQG